LRLKTKNIRCKQDVFEIQQVIIAILRVQVPSSAHYKPHGYAVFLFSVHYFIHRVHQKSPDRKGRGVSFV